MSSPTVRRRQPECLTALRTASRRIRYSCPRWWSESRDSTPEVVSSALTLSGTATSSRSCRAGTRPSPSRSAGAPSRGSWSAPARSSPSPSPCATCRRPAQDLSPQRLVELEALVGDAHRVGHPIVELAADPVPLGGLGTGRYLQGVKPV